MAAKRTGYRGLLIRDDETDLLGRCFEMVIIASSGGLVMFVLWALLR